MGAEFDFSLIFMAHFIFLKQSLKTTKIKVASLTSVSFPFNWLFGICKKFTYDNVYLESFKLFWNISSYIH